MQIARLVAFLLAARMEYSKQPLQWLFLFYKIIVLLIHNHDID